MEMKRLNITNLRKVGGSVMVSIPPALLEQLGLQPGEKVGMKIEDGMLIIQPKPKPHYTLTELLSKKIEHRVKHDEVIDLEATGKELL